VSLAQLLMLYALIWLVCDEKDRFLSNVATADGNLLDNGSIEVSAEHPTDRIRNAGGGRTGSQAGGLTWTMAGRKIIRPRKELDSQPLDIERMSLTTAGGRFAFLDGRLNTREDLATGE
jgi:hypothetical protein